MIEVRILKYFGYTTGIEDAIMADSMTSPRGPSQRAASGGLFNKSVRYVLAL